MPITRLGLGFCRGFQLSNGLPHISVQFYTPDVSEPSLVHSVLVSWVWYPSLSPSSGYTHTTSRTFTHPQLFLVATCYHAHSLTCSLFPLIRLATSSFPVSLLLCQIISYSTHAWGVYWPTYSIPSESCLVRDRLDIQPGTGLSLSVRD